VNPGAQYPHGPLRLGPDTTNALPDIGYRHFSGYNYLDTKVRMFSHTHFVGAGINGLGNLGVMPVRLREGEEDVSLQKWIYSEHDGGDKDVTFNTLVWWSGFSKEREVAVPGKYQVHLDTPSVDATLLATGTLTAIHQYDFSNSADATGHYTPAVVVDICHAAMMSPGITRIRNSNCHNASMSVSDDGQSFTASLLGDKDIWMYFYGEFTTAEGSAIAAKRWTVCSNNDAENDEDSNFSCDTGVKKGSSDNGLLFSRVSFGPMKSDQAARIDLRVGLSYISTDMAKNNYLNDFPESKDDFQERVAETEKAWCDALDFMSVSSVDGDSDSEAMLYSASYRARMTPTIYTEAGGLYLGLDKTVHNATEERGTTYGIGQGSGKVLEFYSDLSFWDTFRGAHPWQLLTDESLAVGVLRSVSEMTVQQNAFPRWVLANQDISCMVGLHGGESYTSICRASCHI
jgi:putative alpha-1,2-mannosidase